MLSTIQRLSAIDGSAGLPNRFSRMLYADAGSFSLGCLCTCAACLVTALQVDTRFVWTVFCLLTVVTMLRIPAIYLNYRFDSFACRFGSSARGFYATSGVIHAVLIGLWVLAVFAGADGSSAELFSFTTALCFMIGLVGRNFASKGLVHAQIAAAGLPMALGLILEVEPWHGVFTVFFGVFCVTLVRIAGNMRETTNHALSVAEDNHRLAHVDDLTELPNKGQMKRLIEAAIQSGQPFALHFLDFDRFKRLNDSYGHAFGDRVLVQAAERLRKLGGQTRIVSRFSGDEFVIIHCGAEGPGDTEHFLDRVIAEFHRPIQINGVSITVGCSIGTAFYPADSRSMSEVLQQADMALYAAKALGRGRRLFFDPVMQKTEIDRMRVESQLREALTLDELSLVFQPIVRTLSRRIGTCEALLRWDHPTDGRLSPDTFLPVAEECGLMNTITDMTLRKACLAAAEWPGEVAVAVNIAPNQLNRPDFVERVRASAAAAGLPLTRLELEITEHLFLEQDQAVLDKLDLLRKDGVKLSLDDFGTGYSNLGYISRLPLDKVKIDKAFVRNLTTSPSDRALLAGMVGLLKSIDLAIVVEGVETAEQLEILMSGDLVESIQGYVFSKPQSAKLIQELLQSYGGDIKVDATVSFADAGCRRKSMSLSSTSSA